jgi:hypothetical protein
MTTKNQKERTKSIKPLAEFPNKISASPPPPEIPPGEFPARLKEDLCRWKRQIDTHKKYFMEKGINPFQEAHEIILSFLDNFDKVAGIKAK